METGRELVLLDEGRVDYTSAMERMERMVESRQRDEAADTLWLLEHPPVYTVGRRTPQWHYPDPSHGIPIVSTRRGGQLTYHGPGQLIGYLIVALREGEGIVDYVREVEMRLVNALEELGVPAERRDTPPGSELLTGVWTRRTNRKIVSIGMRAGRGVTSHGFALGIDNDLAPWDWAVACGMPDVVMTSLSRELTEAGRPVPGAGEVRQVIARAFEAVPADHATVRRQPS